MVVDCTDEEKDALKHNICPDCGKEGFLEGPHGGASVNIMCANEECKSKFNVCMFSRLFLAERID